MHIKHLSLTNFRNYGRLELPLPAGAVVLQGNNAQGKTNLLEAVYYLATSRSPQAGSDQQLINWTAAESGEPIIVGRINAQVETQTGGRIIEMRLIRERNEGRHRPYSFRREAVVNRRTVRLMDLLGNVRVVLFLPQDIQLITGSPSGRRRYMDTVLCQMDKRYCRDLSHYNKALEQRNALLRQLAEGTGRRDTLPIFTDKVVELGSRLFVRRASFMYELGREAQRIHYEHLTSGNESIRLHYLPRLQENGLNRGGTVSQLTALSDFLYKNEMDAGVVGEYFQSIMQATLSADLARGITSTGPHRDDWMIEINGRDLSYFGSRGQQRSGILSLKLAEIDWVTTQTNDPPVLLLDEVAAELDGQRRALLLEYVKHAAQALLTATDSDQFPNDFMDRATLLTVANGRVR